MGPEQRPRADQTAEDPWVNQKPDGGDELRKDMKEPRYSEPTRNRNFGPWTLCHAPSQRIIHLIDSVADYIYHVLPSMQEDRYLNNRWKGMCSLTICIAGLGLCGNPCAVTGERTVISTAGHRNDSTISAKQPRDNFSYDNVSANTKRQTGVSEATKKTCPECYGRGYCEEIDGDIKCLCFEQFYEGADCMTEVNHCKTNPCENDGDCQSVWGNYFCKCRKGFHGVNCTEQGEIKRVARPQFLYNVEVRVPSEDAFILLLDGAKTSSMGEEFSLDYETGTGMKFFAKKLELIKNPRKLAKKYELDPSILHHFPKGNKMGYIIRGYSYTTNGGPVYISIKIKNKNTVQFEGRYLVVPKKNPSFCTPTIVMQDWYELVSSLYQRPLGDDSTSSHNANVGATEYDKAPMYKRGERFSVRSKTTPECTDQEPQLSQYWFQYNISDDAPVPTSDTFRALDTDWNSPTEYAFQPFTMNFGFYLMKVAVLEKVNEIMGARKSSFWNENMCGFHIVPADLVACMVGGESGTVGVHQELRLSAELSYDPNESPYNQQHLRYKWSCSISKHPEGQYCKGKGVQVGTGGSPQTSQPCRGQASWSNLQPLTHAILSPGVLLSIPKDQLQVGSVYEFMVAVWSTKPPVPGYTVNPSNATKKVTVIEGRPAILAIEYVKNVGPYFQSNPEEIVYLKVVCEAECADTMEEMKYEWTFEPAEGSKKTLDWKHDTQFGQNTDKLLILENKLTQSETYLISVTGRDNTWAPQP
uniref:EGF-like domain-containing protein n=1 Tax=Timema cristinae TaxID=61476 RepID=A0A7R9D752_TIMCR|nr:unnamed protein product [Timema cristinae]